MNRPKPGDRVVKLATGLVAAGKLGEVTEVTDNGGFRVAWDGSSKVDATPYTADFWGIGIGPAQPAAPVDDVIEHPKHYTSHPSGVEVIEITEHMNFCLGNAIKYILRSGLKQGADPLEDLRKAEWYVKREIARLSGTRTPSGEDSSPSA